MEFKETLEKRRSIRQYQEKPLDEEMIRAIIADAQNAPSWKNSQTARYIVAHSDKAKDKVLNALPEGNRKKAAKASALLVCTFKKDIAGFTKGIPDNEAGNGWGFYDAGLAHMCLILSAADRGLGTLIMGIRDADSLRAAFSISDDEIITSVIALGYPDIDPAKPRRLDTKEVALFE